MADKDIKINIVTETDLSKLDELDERLSALEEKAGIKVESDVDISGVESIQSKLEEATAEVERLEDALAEAELNGDDIEADIIADQLAEARDEAESLQEALDNLESSTLSPEVDDSSIGEAKDTTEELNDELDEIDNKTVSPEVDDSSISQTKDSVDDLNGSLDMINAAALMGVSGELSSMGANAEGMAQQMNTAAISVGQLSTNVGVAEPQMVAMINHISNATFPQEEAIAYANALNQMGVSADKLGDSATNMDRINDATGIGYANVMQLTQGLQAVGVSADNLPSSFNAIAFAQANVNGGAATMSQVLKTQAATINEYGLNVDQLVLIMQKLSEKGVQGRKMGAELSSVLKECNGDTTALEQSLGMTAGSLSNASGATKQYEGQLQKLANEEAEHKTIVDQLGAAWEDFSLSLSPIMAPLASVMGVIGQAGSYAVGINGLVQLANSMRGLSIITYAKAAADTVAAGAQWLLNAAMSANPIGILIIAITALIAILAYLYFNNEQVRAAIDGLGQTLMWIAGIIWDTIGAAIQWLSDQFNSFTESLGLNSGSWTDAILGFLAFIPTLPLRVGQFLVDTIARALGFGDNFTQTMIDAATNAVTGFIDQVMQLPGMVMETLQGMWDYASTLGGLLPEQASITGNSIIDTVLNVLMTIANIPAALAIYLTDSIASALGFGDNFAQTMMSAAMRGVTGFLTWLVTLPVSIGASLMSTLSQAINFGANFASNLLNAGRNAVNNLVNQIAQAPAMIQAEFNRILSIVSDFVTSLPQRVWDLGASIVGALKSALGIGSPGHMYWMFYGELERLEDAPITMRRNITDNVNRLGTAMVDSFNPELSGMSFANGSVVNGAGNAGGITVNFYDTVVDDDKRMQKIVDAVAREINFNNVTAGRTV